jgi:hypothetical protein
MRHLLPLALLGCGLMISSCATRPPISPAAPRLATPEEARRPCDLHRLPERPTLADLEVGYATRGAQIVACDAARRLAVETLEAEHALEDEARRGRSR